MADSVLQGSLAAFKLPDVLTLLGNGRKSGTLVLHGDGRHSYVLFDQGSLVFAGSDQEKLRLGAVLLRKKKITREQHQQIDAIMTRQGGRYGELAIQKGILTESQLRDFLKVQASEVVFDAFVWSEGTFEFRDELQLPEHAVTIAVDLPNLIMEGSRRIQEWEQCSKLLPDDSIVFRVVVTPKDDKITLTAAEWKILFLINGQRTLADLVIEADDEPLKIYRIVYGLQANRLVEPVTRKAAADDTGARRAAGEETVRQSSPAFGFDSTVRDNNDDTTLLVSREARLSWSDVVKPIVAQLKITAGDGAGTIIPLTEPEDLVGRQQENNIRIADLGISGFHARIFRTTDGFAIEDLKSRNGTWINGGRIFHATLRTGDHLRLGATELTYEVLFEASAK